MRITINALNDKGRMRDNNEDMMSVGGILLRDEGTDLSLDIDECGYFYLLVSDGMGGHEKGEYASRYLLEHLRECFTLKDIRRESFEDDLRDNVLYCSNKLNSRAAFEGQARPMGCTLTGIIWFYGRIYVINAGDSRTYRLRDGILRQLTTDETERGATDDPNASKLLLNCIGGGCAGNLFIEDISEKLMDGDMLLVCSDGLTDMVGEDAIADILERDPQPASGLVERANDEGGADNISAIVALVGNGEFAGGFDGLDEVDDDGRFDAWA